MTERLELEVQGAALFKEALLVCDPATQIEKDAKAVESILDLLVRLRDCSDASRYLQGGMLARLREGERWKAASPELPFWEFCEQKVGLQHRAALQIIQIYETAVRLGLDFGRLTKIGWTKAREFLRVATREDLESWIERAGRMSRADLRKEVRKARQGNGYHKEDSPDLFEVLSVRVTQEQRLNIESAIEEAAALAAPNAKTPASRGAALDYLAVEWRAGHLDAKERALAWHVANLERAYGVTLAIVEPTDITPVRSMVEEQPHA